MASDRISTRQTLVDAKLGTLAINIEQQAAAKKYSRVILLVVALNVISAVLFMRLVNRPVYDDPYNITDVHAYAMKGFSSATMLAQTNPPGPGSFIWMAEAVRLLKGGELLDGRIGALLSWVLLTAGVFFLARYSNFPEIWFAALLVVLVFPHAVEAGATILTEGPSLFFAVLGALAWTEFASRPDVTPGTLLMGLAGGAAMGVAVTCRQYNLALLPAAAIFGAYQFVRHRRTSRGTAMWLVTAIGSLVLASVPVLLLAMLWKGLSSPGMATGTSYSNWQAGVGLNISRPLIVAFYIAAYLVPLTFPVMSIVKRARSRQVIFVALVCGAVAAHYRLQLLTPGPLHTLIVKLARGSILQSAFVGLIAAVTVYNVCAFGMLLWEKRSMILSTAPVAFALLTVVFFVAEQIGVGGNIPFYDRYVLSVAPFLGLIAFSVLPQLTYPRMLALATMSFAGQIILWRYAFGG